MSEHTQIRPCPICGRPPIDRYKPFCSSRCSMLDLGNWLGERYRVESGEDEDAVPEEKETE